MTELPEPTPLSPELPEPLPSAPLQRSRRRLATSLAIAGVALTGAGVAGYGGVNYWVRNHLPGLLAQELSQVLNRPVQVGKVEGFSLSGIRLGETTLPAQLGVPESLAIGSIEVGYSLPGLLRRSLPLTISLNNLSIAAKQTADGTWVSLNPNLPPWQDLPVNINAKLRIKNAQAVLQPYGKSAAMTIPLNGIVQLFQSRKGQARYQADLTLAGGKVQARGETQLQTGKTRLSAQVRELELAQFNPLNPLDVARLTNGNLTADVQLEVPDFTFKQVPVVRGTVQVEDVEVWTEQVAEPLTARVRLLLEGTQAVVEQAQGRLGDAQANVSGTVDWSAGIKDAAVDLAIDIPPVDLNRLRQTVGIELPIALEGSFQGKLQLTGTLSDPVLTGDMDNTTSTQVDRVMLSRVRASIAGDRTRLALTQFRAVPMVGGEITAQAEIPLPRNLARLDPLQLPIALQFRATLPADGIAAAYNLPGTIRPGTITAEGSAQGSLSNPQATVTWQLANGSVRQVGSLSGKGRAMLVGDQLALEDTTLQVGEGTVQATGRANLTSLRWQLAVNARDLDVSGFKPGLIAPQPPLRDCYGRFCSTPVKPGLSGFAPLLADSHPLPPVTARLALSGDLRSLLLPEPSTTIALDQLTANVAGQTLTASGAINLAQRGTWTAATVIDVAVRSNLAELPVRSVVSPLVAEQVNLAGRADFRGQLVGRNLLGNLLDPGNLRLVGNLSLRDVVANRLQLEPLLTGTVDAGLGRSFNLNLRGQRDHIITSLSPCQEVRCPLPYLPNTLDIRQGEGNTALVVAGNRMGDRFTLRAANLDLALLNIAPSPLLTRLYGLPTLPSPIVGAIKGFDATVNLSTLATTGDIRVVRPGLGHVRLVSTDPQGLAIEPEEAEEVVASFAYQNGVFQVPSATIRLGSSRYDIAANLNLRSGAVDAHVGAQGDLQDLLTLMDWFEVTDLLRGLQNPSYASASDLQVQPIGDPSLSLAMLLNTLAQANQGMITTTKQQRQILQAPTQLAVNAKYSGTIALSGTLGNPALDFEFQGHQWQWYPDRPMMMFKDGQLVQDKGRVLTLERVLAKGRFQHGVLTIDPATAEFAGATASFQGSASLDRLAGTFRLDQFPLEQLRQVMPLPVDLRGYFSAEGTLGGEALNPYVQGAIAITNTTLNNAALQPIRGKFSYADARMTFDTTEPEFIRVNASLPLVSGNDLSLTVNLETDAIALIGALSGEQLILDSGRGSVRVQVGGILDLSDPPRSTVANLLATGTISLSNLVFKTPLLEEKLTLDGEVLLTLDRLKAEQLSGQFANSRLLINGALGLLEPLPVDDPDAVLPLTVAIDQGRLDLKTLFAGYNGFIDSQISIIRSLLNPVITGNVRLYEGSVFLSQDTLKLGDAFNTGTGANPLAKLGGWMPQLDNFEVTLGDGFHIRAPFVFVRPSGSLSVNGTLDNLRPEGIIQVYRGEIDLLSTLFYLPRNRQHTVMFTRDSGLLNPFLDIQFQTIVQERPNTQRRTAVDNEIRQDIIPNLRPEDIYVYLTIQGEGASLLSGLQAANRCEFRTVDNSGVVVGPFKANDRGELSAEELKRLETCIYTARRQGSGNQEQATQYQPPGSQLLNSGVVRLESNPRRTQNQLITLLGDESLYFVDELQQTVQRGDQGAIAQFFGYRYVVAPTLRETVEDINDFTRRTGRSIGATDLRVLPTLRATRQVGEQSFVDLEYDYSASQSRLLFRASF